MVSQTLITALVELRIRVGKGDLMSVSSDVFISNVHGYR